MFESIADFAAGFWKDYRFEVIASITLIVGTMVVLWLFRRWLRRWYKSIIAEMADSDASHERERAQRLLTLCRVARTVVTLAVWSVVILTLFALWGVPMTPFLAVGTTVGVAIGFGAQDVIRDIIAGLVILLEDQYSIGDVVEIAGATGTVEKINLRTTVLRDLSGNVHHVPNGQIKVASNLTSTLARYVADIPISYDADVDAAMDVIIDTAKAMAGDPDWSDRFVEEPEMLGVNELGDSGVIIRVMLTVATEQRWAVKREFLKRVKLSLDNAGIEIPYTYLNVVLKNKD